MKIKMKKQIKIIINLMRQWHFCNTNATGQNDVVSNRIGGALWVDSTGGKHIFEPKQGKVGSNKQFHRAEPLFSS